LKIILLRNEGEFASTLSLFLIKYCSFEKEINLLKSSVKPQFEKILSIVNIFSKIVEN
jgi:hypothetical protein